ASMRRKNLSASRIGCAYLVINAVLGEAVRDKKLAESPCTGIALPSVVTQKDFILPARAQIQTLAAGLPADWAATVWLMHGCGLRVGEALAVNLRCRINTDQTLRVKEQTDPGAQLKPLKFRKPGEFRDIPLPVYVSEPSTSTSPSTARPPTGICSRAGSTSWSSAAAIRKPFSEPPRKPVSRRNSSRTHCATTTLPP